MGDVGSAVATPFVAVATTVTGTANEKLYYDCPNCGEEVWLYASAAAFKGRPCLDCRSSSSSSGDVINAVVTSIGRSYESTANGSYTESGCFGDNERIIRIRVRSIWLDNGALCAPGSVFTGALTGNSLTHWWVEIETNASNGWYCAMWIKPNLSITSHSSRDEVTRKGKSAVDAQNEYKNITDKYTYSPSNGKTIGQLRSWMEQYRNNEGPYDIVSNNCQHFGKALYDWL